MSNFARGCIVFFAILFVAQFAQPNISVGTVVSNTLFGAINIALVYVIGMYFIKASKKAKNYKKDKGYNNIIPDSDYIGAGAGVEYGVGDTTGVSGLSSFRND